MDHISQLLSKVIAKRGLQKHVRASQVIHHASGFIEDHLPEARSEIIPTKFDDGILEIRCTHPLFSQEISSIKPELYAYLKNEGFSDVSEIRILRT